MKPFIYFIKYLISFELKFSLIVICIKHPPLHLD